MKAAELREHVAQLEQENAELRRQIAEHAAHRDGIPIELYDDVRWRMAAGLPKDIAIQAARQQAASDGRLAKAEKTI